MKKLAGVALLGVLALLAIVATALATDSSGVMSTSLAQGNVEQIDVRVKTGAWKVQIDTKGPTTLAVSENRVAPGGHFGWHSHPGPSLVIVKSGTSTFYRGDDPDCTPEVHRTGTAYVDPGGVVHTARNESLTEPLVLLVTRLVPEGAAPRIDEPDPGNCNF
ncbi:MAG: cupin domain-containing protein [Actinomycetota bacterium]|nr:cupin domain-containing protein [Actinomycetota bacterium]